MGIPLERSFSLKELRSSMLACRSICDDIRHLGLLQDAEPDRADEKVTSVILTSVI